MFRVKLHIYFDSGLYNVYRSCQILHCHLRPFLFILSISCIHIAANLHNICHAELYLLPCLFKYIRVFVKQKCFAYSLVYKLSCRPSEITFNNDHLVI